MISEKSRKHKKKLKPNKRHSLKGLVIKIIQLKNSLNE